MSPGTLHLCACVAAFSRGVRVYNIHVYTPYTKLELGLVQW